MIISFWSYETCSLAHELSNVVEEGTLYFTRNALTQRVRTTALVTAGRAVLVWVPIGYGV